jgi:tetratricopeptide (TPR) repeat protein
MTHAPSARRLPPPARLHKVLPAMLLLLLPALARAQSREDMEHAKASFQAGAAAYAMGEYLAAIQALDAAYALTPAPAIAFSLAQAERRQYFVGHEREHLDRAILLYRRYLEQVTTGGRRADALDALSQLEPLAAAQTRASSGRPDGVSEANRATRLMITAEAPGSRVALDGGPPVPSPLIREVEPGKHQVEIGADGFFPQQREITAVAGELIPLVVALRERASTVTISTKDQADIYLDGAYLGPGGKAVTLQLPSGVHHLAVARNGYGVATRRLELERGKPERVDITLAPTRQRVAARVLFVGAGGFALTTAVFALLALDAQSHAEEVQSRLAHQNVTPGDRASYQDALVHRDRYRAVALGSGVWMAACLTTGLFLYQFDQPSSGQLYRGADSEHGKPPPTTLSRLQISPLALGGGLGAGIGGRF